MSIYRQGPSPAGACPRCREPLLGIADVPNVRRCEKCGGVFADNAASRKIVNTFDRILLEVGFSSSQGKPSPRETGLALTCPECLVGMHKVRIESAVCEIDVCPAHGSWFDPGELEVVMRPTSEHAKRARALRPAAMRSQRPTTSSTSSG